MRYDRIIITGASSGFGMAYARYLGAECSEMLLVARRAEILEELKQELSSSYSRLQISLHACDLSDASSRKLLGQALCANANHKRTLLINNAGLGDLGAFADASPERIRQMMMVNMVALTELTHAILPSLIAHGGAIMNISSLASDLFIPDFAVYAATKAYVSSFSEALKIELEEHQIPVLAVCPGPVHTGFGKVARRANEGTQSSAMDGTAFFETDVTTVVEGSLNALRAGRSRFYPSMRVRLLALLIRSLPLWMLRLILGRRPRRLRPDPSLLENKS